MSPVFEIRNVTGRSALGALGREQPITFQIQRGEVIVIFGGKETSSLFRLIMGTGEIDSGDITLAGIGRSAITRSKNASRSTLSAWRQRIGFVFRDKGLISNISIIDNVDLPAKYHGRYKPGMRRGSLAEDALLGVGIDDKVWNLRPAHISTELRKKVLMARALVLDPDLLILDDPSVMMASSSIPELLRWVRHQQARGRAILCGTNDYPVGLALATWVMKPGTNELTRDFASLFAPEWIACAHLLNQTTKLPHARGA